MTFLSGASRIHRKQFEKFVEQAGTPVTVRQPAVRVPGTMADRVLGKMAIEEGVGATQTITVVWNTDLSVRWESPDLTVPKVIADLARMEKLDAVLRAKLSDALIVPGDVFGRTVFDTAKDVFYGNYAWQVTGTVRTGLEPEGPYILWIAVKKIGA